MNKQTRRVLFAALLSLSVYGATWYWYRSQKTLVDQHEGMKPIAYVSSVQEDARRRPAARLIWQVLAPGDPLYTGEAIKTSDKSEARIQFTNGDRYIDLDPDSLVVISAGKNEISLDLMDGSILVAGGNDKPAEGAPLLTLNSAAGKVDLSHATASLSKSSQGVSVQVLKGKATTENGQELKDSEVETIKILSPRADRAAIINPEIREPVRFAWEGFPPNASVSLWMGSSRKDLQMQAQTSSNTNSSLEKQVKPGKYFFKLIAKDPKDPNNQLESKIHRFEVMSKYPPGAISPVNDFSLISDQQENPVTFQWNRPEDAENVSLEIAKDPQFKNKFISKDFSDKRKSFMQGLPPGEYYWRLSSTYPEVDHALFSRPMHLSISAKPKVALKINWLSTGQAGAEKETQFYLGNSEKPTMKLAWDTDKQSDEQNKVKTWKVHYWLASLGRQPATTSEISQATDKSNLKVDLPGPGDYFVTVDAYSENEVLLASSETKSVEVAVRPLLKAPLFEPEAGNLNADNHGKLNLKWSSESEAKEYHLRLLDKDGKELKDAKFNKNSTSLVNLMPGQYQVDVYAIDNYGRESERSQPRTVVVPDSSGMKAPKLKKVQVD